MNSELKLVRLMHPALFGYTEKHECMNCILILWQYIRYYYVLLSYFIEFVYCCMKIHKYLECQILDLPKTHVLRFANVAGNFDIVGNNF